METAQRTLFLSERMMTLANIMYNYIIASGARDVVDRYERQALDEALNIDLTNSYYDALIRHRIKTNIQFSEAFLAVQDREPAYMRTVDEEVGDLLCDQATRYGDWKLGWHLFLRCRLVCQNGILFDWLSQFGFANVELYVQPMCLT